MNVGSMRSRPSMIASVWSRMRAVKAPGMVKVAVPRGRCPRRGGGRSPIFRAVGDEDIRVAGIEEDAGPAVLEIEREPWFREEVAVGEGDVIHEDRQPHARALPTECDCGRDRVHADTWERSG